MPNAIEKIKNDPELANFIDASRTPLRMACNTAQGFPLIVPLWFLFDNDAFWCVTHKDAKLLTHLRIDPRVGFEIANNEPPYAGTRGNGTVELMPTEGAALLSRLLARYCIRQESQLARWLISRADDEVAIKIVPHYINGWDYKQRMQDTQG